MAQKPEFTVANIADPKWVLSEKTGKLSFEGLRYVSGSPRQLVVIEHISDLVTPEFADRYRRIIEDRKARGVA
jgi:hypothetical protein